MKTHYIVTIEGSEVPPGWAEKMEQKLRDDLRLSFGSGVTVRQGIPLPPPVPRYVHVVLRGRRDRTACGVQFEEDLSWTSEPDRFPEVSCPSCRRLLEAGLR